MTTFRSSQRSALGTTGVGTSPAQIASTGVAAVAFPAVARS